MKQRGLLILLLTAFAFTGCGTVRPTKADVRNYQFSSEELVGDYHALARKWDEKAVKISVDFKPATTLLYDEAARTAQITVQGIYGIHGMIELVDLGGGRTRMTAYSDDPGMKRNLVKWMEIIRAP